MSKSEDQKTFRGAWYSTADLRTVNANRKTDPHQEGEMLLE